MSQKASLVFTSLIMLRIVQLHRSTHENSSSFYPTTSMIDESTIEKHESSYVVDGKESILAAEKERKERALEIKAIEEEALKIKALQEEALKIKSKEEMARKEKVHGEKAHGEKAHGEKAHGEKAHGEKVHGEKAQVKTEDGSRKHKHGNDTKNESIKHEEHHKKHKSNKRHGDEQVDDVNKDKVRGAKEAIAETITGQEDQDNKIGVKEIVDTDKVHKDTDGLDKVIEEKKRFEQMNRELTETLARSKKILADLEEKVKEKETKKMEQEKEAKRIEQEKEQKLWQEKLNTEKDRIKEERENLKPNHDAYKTKEPVIKTGKAFGSSWYKDLYSGWGKKEDTPPPPQTGIGKKPSQKKLNKKKRWSNMDFPSDYC